MAVGIVMCGAGMGMLVFVPLTQFLIERVGWRGAFLGIAVIVVMWVGPLNAVFQRTRPEDMGLAPDGDDIVPPGDKGGGGSLTSNKTHLWTLSDAIRHRSFWMMCMATFCNPWATFTIVLHQVAYMVERGFETGYVTSVLGFVGVFAMVGRVICGMLSDRIGREYAYTIFMISAALATGFLFLLTEARAWILPVYVVLLGLGMGVGGAMFPTMMADLFPGPSLGRIMGITSAFGGFGAGLGTYFAGEMHDVTGTYTWGLFSVLVTVVGAVVFVWIAAPRKVRSFGKKQE
jgi:MFS family permease